MPDNKTLWQVSLSKGYENSYNLQMSLKGYFWDSLADCLR